MGADVLYVTPCCNSARYSTLYEFTCLIKSHCEYPDYEQTVTATNKANAVDKFYQMLKGEYNKLDLYNRYVDEGVITEFNECECGNVFKELAEEVVDYGDENKRS